MAKFGLLIFLTWQPYRQKAKFLNCHLLVFTFSYPVFLAYPYFLPDPRLPEEREVCLGLRGVFLNDEASRPTESLRIKRKEKLMLKFLYFYLKA